MSQDLTHSSSGAVAQPTTGSPLAGCLMALLAGALGWALIQGLHPVFEVPKEYAVESLNAPPEKFLALEAARARTDAKSLTLYFSLLGALLALGQVAWQRSLAQALVALPIGLTLGGLAGIAGSLAHNRWVQGQAGAEGGTVDIAQVVAVQAILLGGLGVAAGLALGAASRSPRTMAIGALGGLAGGALAGALYLVVMSVAVPTVGTTSLFPLEAGSRLLWIELAAGLIGLMVPLALRGRPAPKHLLAGA